MIAGQRPEPSRRTILKACAGWAVLGLAACGDGGAGKSAASIATLNRGNGAEPESLDPPLADTQWEQSILGDLMLGLFTEDAEGKPIPGAAMEAAVSSDGLVWTFQLRDHRWSDGMPVTAGDFVYAWRRLLDPKTGSKFAAIAYPFKNAKAIAEGLAAPDTLGVRAEGDTTLVLELEHPAPYLRELVTHNILYPVPRHVVEAKGAEWTQVRNYVSNGAYTLAERVPNGHIALAKNPRFYDSENVRIARVMFYPTEDAGAALTRFRAGELDTQEPFPADQIDWLRQNMPGALKQVPTLSIDYIVLNIRRKPFDDARVREALNLALDRDTIAQKIYRIGEQPAYNIVPPGIANYPGGAAFAFKTLPYPERIARAQELMRAAGYGPDRRLRTTFATAALPDARRAAAAVQAMWQTVYVDLDIVQADSAVTYSKLRQYDFDIGTANWGADFNDAANFLMLLTTGNPQNYAGYSNSAYDALYAAAEKEPDAGKRGALLLQAEAIALKDHAWITRNFRTSRVIVRPRVKGWIANARNFNRTRWLTLENA